ncbi:MAG: aspartyl protease family protein [Dehalococcoidia bacterium]
MPDKTFEHVIRFYEVTTGAGASVWLPLITVYLIQPSGNRVALPLLFDTGASVITLRHDLYVLLGVPSWDSGVPQSVATAGGAALVQAYRYRAMLEVLGKTLQCPIHLQMLPSNPLYVGLFGRETVFEHFGFGFWERTQELYITANP